MFFHVYFIFTLIILRIGLESRAQGGEKPHRRIVQGSDSQIEKHPYQVFIYIDPGQQCSGSIISETLILTAAHCLDRKIASDLTLWYGLTSADKRGEGYDCNKIAVHPNFNTTSMDNDVGLIWVDKININNITTKIIDVAYASNVLNPGSEVTVSGWGKTWHNETFTGDLSVRLQAVQVTVVDWGRCKDLYEVLRKRIISQRNDVSTIIPPMVITNTMWCAGNLEVGGKDACAGDSGASAVQDNKIVGLVSWSYYCGRADAPGVYTDVSKIDWIAEQIRGSGSVTTNTSMVDSNVTLNKPNF